MSGKRICTERQGRVPRAPICECAMPEYGSSPILVAARLQNAGVPELAVLLAASLGCLQPAIDPVFLTLLSEAGQVSLSSHGLIVGGTQAGAAAGGLLVWRYGERMPQSLFVAAAALACLAGLLTAATTAFAAILLLRCAYGAAMGMVFAHAMARCAARHPNTAYGGMFLLQLLLATLASLALPALALARGPHAALALLALAPALAFAALLVAGPLRAGETGSAHHTGSGSAAQVPPAGWALAAATFCSICATMLVWSFAGALAATAGIAESVIGEAVALGSLVGAATALAVMRERVLVPLPVTALLASMMLISPILLTSPGHDQAFVLSIILLNIGSTALIVRCSGLATATSRDSRFRTLVACTHSLGMIAGPLTGSILMATLGSQGLLAGVAVVLTVGFAAIAFAAKQGVIMHSLRVDLMPDRTSTDSRQSA